LIKIYIVTYGCDGRYDNIIAFFSEEKAKAYVFENGERGYYIDEIDLKAD